MPKAFLTVVGGFIAAISLLLGVHGFTDPDLDGAATAARLVHVAVITTLVVLTASVGWRPSPLKMAAPHWPLGAAGSLGLLGAGTILGALSLGRRTGDMELYIVVLGLAMIAQGLLAAFGVWSARRVSG